MSASTTETLLQKQVYTRITDLYNGTELVYARFIGDLYADSMAIQYSGGLKAMDLKDINFLGIK